MRGRLCQRFVGWVERSETRVLEPQILGQRACRPRYSASRRARGTPAVAGRWASGGFILVAVLWILAALATLATIFSLYLARTAMSLSVSDSDVQTEALVSASLELTAYQLPPPKPGTSPGAAPGTSSGSSATSPGFGAAQPSPGAPSGQDKGPPPPPRGDFSFRLGHANVAVTFIPETARIDINAASPELLTNFFAGLGVPRDQADQYVKRIAGWVTAPKQTQTVLAADNNEEALYRAAGRTYGPRGAPFAHVDELSLVVDIPPVIVERAKPFLTVYTGKAQVDILDAAPEVLAAIPGITPDLMKALAEARKNGADDQAVARLLGGLQLQGVVSIDGGDTYRVQVRIRYDNGRQAAAEAVIRTGSGDRPFAVLWWHDGFEALSSIPGTAGVPPASYR